MSGFDPTVFKISLDLRGLSILAGAFHFDDEVTLGHERGSEHRIALLLRKQARLASERRRVHFRQARNDLAVGDDAVPGMDHEMVPGQEIANQHRFHAAVRKNPERFLFLAAHQHRKRRTRLVSRDVEQHIAYPDHPDYEGGGNIPTRGERRECRRYIEKIDADLSFVERCDAATKWPCCVQRNCCGQRPPKRRGPDEARDESRSAGQSATPPNRSWLVPIACPLVGVALQQLSNNEPLARLFGVVVHERRATAGQVLGSLHSGKAGGEHCQRGELPFTDASYLETHTSP